MIRRVGLNEAAGRGIEVVAGGGVPTTFLPLAGGASTGAVGSTMIATNSISTLPRDDAGAPFSNSVALVEGRYRASRAGLSRVTFPQRLTH